MKLFEKKQESEAPGQPMPQQQDNRPVPQSDLDYVRNAKAAMRGDTVRGANFLLWLIAATLIAFFVWAAKADLDEVTKGQGKVIPSTSMQTVQNLEGGILAEILVKEGGLVKKGQPLVRIDDTQTKSSYRENLAQSQALSAQLSRLEAEAEGFDEITFDKEIIANREDLVNRETALFAKNIGEKNEQLQIMQKSLDLAKEELTMTIPLVRKQVVSRVEQLRLERDVNELEGKIKELSGGFQRDAMKEFNQTKAEFESLNEAIKGREDKVERALVLSPVSGVVNKVYFATIGGVIQPGEPILDIVPEDDKLVVEAKIRPSDIAFLRPGQKAVLKFTAYDFALYGGLDGVVEHISADTIQDEVDKEHYYMIKVRNTGGKLVSKTDEELPIIPGMVAEVDVLTGRRTVLQYLTKPLHRMRFNALRER